MNIDTLVAKISLLRNGYKTEEQIQNSLNPYNLTRAGPSTGILFKLINLTTKEKIFIKIRKKSTGYLLKKCKNSYETKIKTKTYMLKPVKPDREMMKQLPSNACYTPSYVKNLDISITPCTFPINKKCAFCGYAEKMNMATPKYNKKLELMVNGGTYINGNKTAEKYIEYLTKLKKYGWPKEKITIEIFPPEDINLLKKLSTLANYIQLNMEVFDDKLRKKIAPLKPNFDYYMERFLAAKKYFGKYKVSTVIQLLEPPKTLQKYTEMFLNLGILVEPIITQPMRNNWLKNKIPSTKKLLEKAIAINKAAKIIRENQSLDRKKVPICSRCKADNISEIIFEDITFEYCSR